VLARFQQLAFLPFAPIVMVAGQQWAYDPKQAQLLYHCAGRPEDAVKAAAWARTGMMCHLPYTLRPWQFCASYTIDFQAAYSRRFTCER
jgi:hypothetical protein